MTDVFERNVAISARQAAEVVPRAEFRVFGHGIIAAIQERLWDVGAVLRKVRRMAPETYVLSARSDDANVKIRERLLDIKTRTGSTPDGYELFQPRGKFAFPVGKSDLATALRYLDVQMDSLPETCTADGLIALARGHPELVPVNVEKLRYGFTVEGIVCEYAQVWFNGALMESACVESENYGGMRKVVADLRLDALPNVNYLKAAKRIVGML